MRHSICIAMLLCTAPALAADTKPSLVSPPSPPAVTYQVWGFKWDGQRFVKQPADCYTTTDLKKASDYATQVDSFFGWTATTNLPEAAVVHTTFHGAAVTDSRPSAAPPQPTFDVWAFHLQNGQWVKDAQHSWKTTDPEQGIAYAKQVNAVPGWRATDNCPDTVPLNQRYVDGGTLHGAPTYVSAASRLPASIYAGPWGAYLQQMLSGIYVDPNAPGEIDSTPSVSNSNYGDTSDIQNMIATQDMINQQQQLNNIQDTINTQNFINTENMVNNMQDMVNTQNAVNEQNMINAMQ